MCNRCRSASARLRHWAISHIFCSFGAYLKSAWDRIGLRKILLAQIPNYNVPVKKKIIPFVTFSGSEWSFTLPVPVGKSLEIFTQKSEVLKWSPLYAENQGVCSSTIASLLKFGFNVGKGNRSSE